MAALPAQPFFTSPQQRAALARERFFDQGERPTGLVSEAVIQSWSRCFAARRDPGYAVSFDLGTFVELGPTSQLAVRCVR